MDEPTPPAQTPRTVFDFELTDAEGLAALEYNQSRFGRRLRQAPRIGALTVVASAAYLGVMVLVARLVAERERSGLWILAAFASLSVLAALAQSAIRRTTLRLIAAGSATLRGKRIVRIEEEGLRFCGPSEETSIHWSGIRAIEESERQILIYADDFFFLPIPGRAFVDEQERAAIVVELRRRAGCSPAPVKAASLPPQAAIPALEESAGQGHRAAAPRFWDALVEGVRLAFLFRPSIRSREFRRNWSWLLMLMLFSIGIAFAGDLVEVGTKGSFSPSGLPGVLFAVPVMVVGAWALARLAGRPRSTLALLTALMSVTLPIDVVLTLAHLIIKAQTRSWGEWSEHFSKAPYALVPFWFTVAGTVCAVRLLDLPRRRWLPAVLIAGGLIGWPMLLGRADRTLWWPVETETGASGGYERWNALVKEDAYYRQPQLLREQLAALKPGRRGVIDLYFIGVAAYARQDVFMKEVHSVAQLFDERFGTRGRSLMLINNPATVGESPVATSTSLGLALKRVGEVMNRDEDIVFLFITSHGSKEHEASLEFYPMQLKPLEPARLKQLLDEAGIRRRVVVVSACYSGGFVDALKDDNTLAIAASAADRNSFGCSNDADFTYFGKAYFDEALRQTDSFSEAFEVAKGAIAERERKGSLRSSDPQMFVGEGIRRALRRFVSSRHGAVATVSRPTAAK
jgi:peptidase C13-like protein/YcxB-like protein